MSQLAARAEIAKLAILLGVDARRLQFLEAVDSAALVELRIAATNRLFADSRTLAHRLGSASALMPASLIALMSRRVFGAKLSARVAGEMKPVKAVDVALKLPIPFLADVARELDPRRARAILLLLPAETVRDIAIELLRRGEYVTLGRFVDDISPAALRAAIDAIRDPEALLHAAFFVESKHRLDDILGLVSDERLRAAMAFALAGGDALRDEALGLREHVGGKQLQRLLALVPELAGTS